MQSHHRLTLTGESLRKKVPAKGKAGSQAPASKDTD